MPVYLAFIATDGGSLQIEHLSAPTLAAAADELRAHLAPGIDATGGELNRVTVALIQSTVAGQVLPNGEPGQAIFNLVDSTGAPIADLPPLTVATLLQAQSAIQALGAKTNAILAALRDAGIIAR